MGKEILKSKFLTPLDGRWITDNLYMTLRDLEYQSEILEGVLTIPKGFVTDFASVPRIPIVYMLFGDRAHHESVPHDFLYQKHEAIITQPNGKELLVSVSKSLADKVFLEAMKSRGKSFFVRSAMYSGVVIGGFSSYKSGPKRYEKMKKLGEKYG